MIDDGSRVGDFESLCRVQTRCTDFFFVQICVCVCVEKKLLKIDLTTAFCERIHSSATNRDCFPAGQAVADRRNDTFF